MLQLPVQRVELRPQRFIVGQVDFTQFFHSGNLLLRWIKRTVGTGPSRCHSCPTIGTVGKRFRTDCRFDVDDLPTAPQSASDRDMLDYYF